MALMQMYRVASVNNWVRLFRDRVASPIKIAQGGVMDKVIVGTEEGMVFLLYLKSPSLFPSLY